MMTLMPFSLAQYGPYLHCPVTLAAFDAGKHVLTEARMAMNSARAQRMLRPIQVSAPAHRDDRAQPLWIDRRSLFKVP